jgi:hypothetical protein
VFLGAQNLGFHHVWSRCPSYLFIPKKDKKDIPSHPLDLLNKFKLLLINNQTDKVNLLFDQS